MMLINLICEVAGYIWHDITHKSASETDDDDEQEPIFESTPVVNFWPTMNVDGTPMIDGTFIDINGNAFGCTDD